MLVLGPLWSMGVRCACICIHVVNGGVVCLYLEQYA